MALIEAVLVYRPSGVGHEHPVPIGATDDPRVLRALRDRLLECAYEEVHVWHTIDAGVATLKSAEAERLARVLSALLPDADLQPALRVVKREPTPDPGGEPA